MKKGFTLVEVLGVVAILAIITMVATPSIISMVKTANSKMKATEDETIIVAAVKYVKDNPNHTNSSNARDYDLTQKGSVIKVTASTLVTAKYLDANLLLKSSYYKNYYQVDSKGVVTKDSIVVTITVVDANGSITTTIAP